MNELTREKHIKKPKHMLTAPPTRTMTMKKKFLRKIKLVNRLMRLF